jgi:predicted nucleic acid-binding protein
LETDLQSFSHTGAKTLAEAKSTHKGGKTIIIAGCTDLIGTLSDNILASFLNVSRVSTLPIDEDSARRYAAILDYLQRQVTPIPANDIWIAACAMQHGLVLISAGKHFLKLPQIVTEFLEIK